MNYYQEKEKLKYSVFSISGFFSFILYRLFVFKGGKYCFKMDNKHLALL